MKAQCKNCIYLTKLYVPPIYDLPKDKWVCTLFLDKGRVMYLDSDKDMCEEFNGKERHCVNCRHRIIKCDNSECDIDNHYIGYVECFVGWCRHWAKNKKSEEEK